MAGKLEGKKLAILATDGFEQVELTKPRQAALDAGATVHIIAPDGGQIEGHNHRDKGDKFDVDGILEQTAAKDYDALFVPGGLYSPDALRVNDSALSFVRHFFEHKKPVFAICHGPQVLISANVVEGRNMTAFSAIQADLRNAGAHVTDEEVVVDHGLVTSRNPDDLDAFCAKVVEEMAEGKHERQAKSVAA